MLEHAKDLENKTNNQMTKIEEWMEGQMDDRSARYVGKRIFSLADPRYSLGNVAKDDPHPVQHVNIRNDLYRDKEIGYGKNWKPPDDENLLIFMKEALVANIVAHKCKDVAPAERAEKFASFEKECLEMSLPDLYRLHLSFEKDKPELESEIWQTIRDKFEGKFSLVTIYARFRMNLHPDYKPEGEQWTREEEMQLVHFVTELEKHSQQEEEEDEWNWFKCLEFVDTRTPYHSFQHYQRSLNSSEEVCAREFSAADDEQLRRLIEEYGDKNAHNIALQMGDGFTPPAIRGRIRKLSDGIALTKQDPHKEANVNLLVCAAEMYGKSFEEIAEHIPGATAARARDIYDCRLEPFRRRGPWAQDEQELLLDLVKQHGPGSWSLMEKELEGRSAGDIKREWENLEPQAAVRYHMLLAQRGELPTNFVGKEEHRPKILASDISMVTTDGVALEDVVEESMLEGSCDPIEVHASSGNKHLNSLNKVRKNVVKKREFTKRLQSLQDGSKMLPLCDQIKQEAEETDKFAVRKRKKGRPRKALSFDWAAADCSQTKVEVKEEDAKGESVQEGGTEDQGGSSSIVASAFAKKPAKKESKQKAGIKKERNIRREEQNSQINGVVSGGANISSGANRGRKRSILEVIKDQDTFTGYQPARANSSNTTRHAVNKPSDGQASKKIRTATAVQNNELNESDLVLKKPRRSKGKRT
jgi:hypothetical protein